MLPLYRTFRNCLFLPINPLDCCLAPKTSLLLLSFSCQLSPADSGSENQTETAVPCAELGRSFFVSSPDIGEITTVSAETAFWALWANLFNDLEFLHRKNRAASFRQKLFSCCILVSLHPFPSFPSMALLPSPSILHTLYPCHTIFLCGTLALRGPTPVPFLLPILNAPFSSEKLALFCLHLSPKSRDAITC